MLNQLDKLQWLIKLSSNSEWNNHYYKVVGWTDHDFNVKERMWFQAVGVLCVHDLEVYYVELLPGSGQWDHMPLNKNLLYWSWTGWYLILLPGR